MQQAEGHPEDPLPNCIWGDSNSERPTPEVSEAWRFSRDVIAGKALTRAVGIDDVILILS